MKQWEVFDYPFSHPVGIHPVVILSPTEVASNSDIKEVNVLLVTTVRADYRPGKGDVLLNGADGLDHLSRVRVLPIYQVAKENLRGRRGEISGVRQKVVARKIREIYRLD